MRDDVTALAKHFDIRRFVVGRVFVFVVSVGSLSAATLALTEHWNNPTCTPAPDFSGGIISSPVVMLWPCSHAFTDVFSVLAKALLRSRNYLWNVFAAFPGSISTCSFVGIHDSHFTTN